MHKYITSQGDMWDSISKKIYGSEHYMSRLISVNKTYRKIIVFPAGLELIIPDMPIEQIEILPPWKR